MPAKDWRARPLIKAFDRGMKIRSVETDDLGVSVRRLSAASWAETYLPGRSAEITDALMALLIGIIIAVVKTPTEGSRSGPA